MAKGTEPAHQPDGGFVLSPEEQRVIRTLITALRRIRHGSVQIVVQDGRVVQIDTLEKHRFSRQDDVAI